jgi:hypothetical protein
MKKSILLLLSVIVILILSLQSCKKDSNTNPTGSDYIVMAWNNLGMHCLNPTYDELVILPPYNTIYAQVIKRGNPPTVVTNGIKVRYRIIDNTYSYGKRQYGGFWDNSQPLFGINLQHDIGLTGNGLSGEMVVTGNQFFIEGIPVVPVNDNDTWNPYQVAEITVEDAAGNTLITTHATVPTSDEIDCAGCHGVNAFNDILTKHDNANGTNLLGSQPVLCASCHPSPALGTPGTGQKYLSEAIHGFHATTNATCYSCHPGQTTKCNRSLRHTADDGNCTACHGDLAQVGSSITAGRVPWVTEPKCVTCHTGVNGVDTGNELYRNSEGHGNLACPACHGSPHTMYPSRETTDNYQPLQYQNFSSKIKTIGSCGVCHDSSRGADNLGEFSEAHGGSHPEETNACHICHTQVPTDQSKWPHAYTWKNSN